MSADPSFVQLQPVVGERDERPFPLHFAQGRADSAGRIRPLCTDRRLTGRVRNERSPSDSGRGPRKPTGVERLLFKIRFAAERVARLEGGTGCAIIALLCELHAVARIPLSGREHAFCWLCRCRLCMSEAGNRKKCSDEKALLFTLEATTSKHSTRCLQLFQQHYRC